MSATLDGLTAGFPGPKRTLVLTGSPSGAPSSLVTSQTSFAPNVKSPLLEPTTVVPASEPRFVCQLIGTVMSAPVVLRRAANVRIVEVDFVNRLARKALVAGHRVEIGEPPGARWRRPRSSAVQCTAQKERRRIDRRQEKAGRDKSEQRANDVEP